MQQYLSSLCAEIASFAPRASKHMVTTIFIGGGTPSAMFNGAVATILATIRKHYNLSTDCEITIEANPNTITYAKAHEWYTAGVNRVSVGLQTDRKHILGLIGRTHTRADYINGMRTLKNVGFTNINTDLMIGLPSQKQSHVKSAIRLAHAMGSTHISCYCLILEEGTPLHAMVNAGELRLPTEAKTLNMYNFAYSYMRSLGYERYEVSNFATSGHQCKHNVNTWRMVEYVGFGAGAHSYFHNVRWNKYEDVIDYIKGVNDKNPIEFSEKITKDEKLEETIMLGLRLASGIDTKQITKQFGIDLMQTKAKEIAHLIELGLIHIDGTRIYATDYGFCMLNQVILQLV